MTKEQREAIDAALIEKFGVEEFRSIPRAKRRGIEREVMREWKRRAWIERNRQYERNRRKRLEDEQTDEG